MQAKTFMLVAGINVRVNRKGIKNMHLYVKPPDGAVSVSAPLKMGDNSIERFVRSKIGWIKKHQERIASRPRESERLYVSGETLRLFGEQYFLKVRCGERNALELLEDSAILTAREKSTAEQRGNFIREWYREKLKGEVSRLLPKWESVTGLKCESWQTKYMVSRWGTCNIMKRKIWLNPHLAKKPIKCLEYIILHELLHLRVNNHGAEFKALMDKYMPSWRDVRKRLNEGGVDS